jgi:hypothetical protein
VTLTELARKVALARKASAGVREKYQMDKAAFDAAHTADIELFRRLESETYNAEMALREALIAEHLATGNKKFGMGAIKIMRRMTYDAAQAMTWAIKHQQCLNLNVSAFEKVVKALPDDLELKAIAQVIEEPTAALNSDMDAFLATDGGGDFA